MPFTRQISPHVIVARDESYPTVEIAERMTKALLDSAPPGMTILIVGGPVAADKPEAVREQEANDQPEQE